MGSRWCLQSRTLRCSRIEQICFLTCSRLQKSRSIDGSFYRQNILPFEQICRHMYSVPTKQCAHRRISWWPLAICSACANMGAADNFAGLVCCFVACWEDLMQCNSKACYHQEIISLPNGPIFMQVGAKRTDCNLAIVTNKPDTICVYLAVILCSKSGALTETQIKGL